MDRFRLGRRTLLKAMTALAVTPIPELVEAEETRKKFWFLDQRHTGQREFFHVLGYVSRDVSLPPSQLDGFKGDVVFANNGKWTDIGWEVEQVLSSDKMLYRARIIPTIEKVSPLVGYVNGDLLPVYESAEPWMSPSEAKDRYGIVIRRS